MSYHDFIYSFDLHKHLIKSNLVWLYEMKKGEQKNTFLIVICVGVGFDLGAVDVFNQAAAAVWTLLGRPISKDDCN
ncbi:hypothetical protein DERP_003811 [Dermatophagoides pteronyssinus]|uniref:Uncharacterized protein n=1 Tax=Dermatophagoides pteronyssinus TaxID=6956 RepID=A0ABQ8JLP1_DERPT|nr:hypothetical protein DERP_003811 [Dermatophagoides pteronyssinus]